MSKGLAALSRREKTIEVRETTIVIVQPSVAALALLLSRHKSAIEYLVTLINDRLVSLAEEARQSRQTDSTASQDLAVIKKGEQETDKEAAGRSLIKKGLLVIKEAVLPHLGDFLQQFPLAIAESVAVACGEYETKLSSGRLELHINEEALNYAVNMDPESQLIVLLAAYEYLQESSLKYVDTLKRFFQRKAPTTG